ncbi:MAG: SUMF1/EgtB/PvdO family nonheme iron enzyme, partial [Rubripirellula sp.]|nr:SUMF1/EgtB/PvdO family nonheme iron enzyme [Rubripirellula sp.]
LARLRSKQSESESLLNLIRDQINAGNLNNLLGDVEKLLELLPKRTDVLKLREQLLERNTKMKGIRETCYQKALDEFKSQNYQECLTQLSRIDPHVENEEVQTLRAASEQKQKRLMQLQDRIRSAVALSQYDDLLEDVEEFLLLRQSDAGMRKLRDQLIALSEKQAEHLKTVFAKAKTLQIQCQFEKAIAAIDRIPQSFRNDNFDALARECRSLADKRRAAMNALSNSEKTQKFAAGLQESKPYHSILIANPAFKDTDYNSLHQRVKAGLQRQRKERQDAKDQIKKLQRIWLGFAVAVAAVLLTSFGMWVHSVKRSNQLAAALAEERWDEALLFEPENLTALIGRANQSLDGANPDLNSILSEVERLNTLAPGDPAINQLSGKIHVLRSIKASTQGDVDTGETEFRRAERLKAETPYLERAKRSLAWAYAQRADTILASGNIKRAIDDASRALSLEPDIEISTPVEIAIAEEKATELVNAYVAKPDQPDRDAMFAALALLSSLNNESMVLASLRSQLKKNDLAVAESRAADRIEVFGREATELNLAESELALSDLEILDPDSSKLKSLRSTLQSLLLSSAESRAIAAVQSCRLETTPTNLDTALSALAELKKLNPNSPEIGPLTSAIQTILTTRAESIVAEYEKEPTDMKLRNAMSAVRAAEELVVNPENQSLQLLHDRIAAVLTRQIEAFEADHNDANLQSAIEASRQIEMTLRNPALRLSANTRIVKAMLDRMEEIPIDKAIAEMELLDDLNADLKIRESANKLLDSKRIQRFNLSIRNKDYSVAAIDFVAIAESDRDAADKLSSAWLRIPKLDYEKIPEAVLSILPPTLLANFPSSLSGTWKPAISLRLPPESVANLPLFTNSIGMTLKAVPQGTFIMGGNSENEGKPAHQVTLSKSFLIGTHEVSQEQYERVMGVNPSAFKSPRNPVENVSWENAMDFCSQLSASPSEKSAGRVYRLPSEAEWEYACRAGTTTKYSFGDLNNSSQYCWHSGNSGGRASPVGQKLPNPWGLYDMHGNVWEWCLDGNGAYPAESVTDPVGPKSETDHIYRGGSWRHGSDLCSSAIRGYLAPNAKEGNRGFRVCCIPVEQ